MAQVHVAGPRRPSTSLRSDLAVCGVDLGADAPSRAGLAYLLVDGVSIAVPVAAASKYRVREGRLLLDGADLGLAVVAPDRPRFYDLRTADGVAYETLARRHGPDVLTVTVGGPRVVLPSAFAQLVADAVRLDAVTSVIVSGGRAAGPVRDADRDARYLVQCVEAVAGAAPSLPMQVQIPLPHTMSLLGELHTAGAGSLALHVESAELVGRPVWREAVRLFGRNQVSTYVVVGSDTDPDVAVDWAGELIRLGVYPLVVPFRPAVGSLPADGGRVRGLPSWLVAEISDRVAELLVDAGMRGADQVAGCAACGACSSLRSAGG